MTTIIQRLRDMKAGQSIEMPADKSPYLRNAVSQRLIKERLQGMAWSVNLDMERGITIVTRTQ